MYILIHERALLAGDLVMRAGNDPNDPDVADEVVKVVASPRVPAGALGYIIPDFADHADRKYIEARNPGVPLWFWRRDTAQAQPPQPPAAYYEILLNAINEEEPMATRKPAKKLAPKPAPEIKEDLSKRVSVTGLTYPLSHPYDWMEYEGVGWVHSTELDWFNNTYCDIEDLGSGRHLWAKKSDVVMTVGNSYITKKKFDEEGWVLCDASGKADRKENIIRAFDEKNRSVGVSIKLVEEGSYFLDGDNGKYYHHVHRVAVSSCKKEKKRYYVSSATSKNGKYGQCGHCGYHFEIAEVASRPELGGAVYCDKCYTAKMREIAIRSYNYKHYPAPIYQRPNRRITPDNELMLERYVVENGLDPIGFVRLYGLEVETEISRKLAEKANTDRFSIAMGVVRDMGADFLLAKEDGTLITNGKYSEGGNKYAGFEIVTAPCDLATHRERWGKFESFEWHKFLRAWDTETCGLHIHVSRAAISNLTIGRILYFVNHPKNKAFIQKVAGRCEDKYNKLHEKKLVDALHPERVINPQEESEYNRRRRVAVNLSNTNTIEFRIFRGTVRACHIMRNIEFVDALINFCSPCGVSLQVMHKHKEFIRYVASRRKEWPEFARWLELHNMIPEDLLPKVKPFNPKDTRGTKAPEMAEHELFPTIYKEPAKQKEEAPGVIPAWAAEPAPALGNIGQPAAVFIGNAAAVLADLDEDVIPEHEDDGDEDNDDQF